MSATDLTIQAGEPFSITVRLVNGKTVWTNLSDFEVRSQVRQQRNEAARLLLDLTPFLSAAFSTNDILVTLSLTGAETRLLATTAPTGYYDMIVSDVGATDARAIMLIFGSIMVNPVVTSAS